METTTVHHLALSQTLRVPYQNLPTRTSPSALPEADQKAGDLVGALELIPKNTSLVSHSPSLLFFTY